MSGEVLDDEPQQRFYATYDPDEEPVDAEWEDIAQDGESRSWRERWDRARSFFETRAQQREDERQRQRDADRKWMNATEGLGERDELTLLRENIRAAGDTYMESLRRSEILAPGFNDGERAQKVSALHSVYAQMMVASCLRPLQQGVNTASVVRAASTMVSMYMLSPTFKAAIQEYAEPVQDAIQDRIDAKARSKRDKVEGRANAHRAERGKDVKPTVEPKLSKRWQKRIDDLRFRERGYREMHTARSAAMTEVALTESSFAKLREPKADTAQIMKSYHAMVGLLYQQAEEDGLSREEVAEASRVVLGERMREDPRVQTMVSGFAHGQHRMSVPHEERVADTDRVQTVWRGDFEDCLGRPVDPTRYADAETKEGIRGAFTLRGSMGATDHRSAVAQTMSVTLADAIERGDMRAFNEDLAGYMLGETARARDFDGAGIRGAIPERLFQARTMLASMTADGFNAEEQREIYSNAYVDAIEAMGEVYPEFGRRWGETYGEGWQNFMRDAVADPERAHRLWAERQASNGRQEQQSSQDGPGPEQENDTEYQTA